MSIAALTVYYLEQSPCERVWSKITTMRRAPFWMGMSGEDEDNKHTKKIKVHFKGKVKILMK